MGKKVIAIFLALLLLPMNVFADSEALSLPEIPEMPEVKKLEKKELPELPKLEIPKLDLSEVENPKLDKEIDTPKLENPKFSSDYEKLLKDLEKEGHGKSKYDRDKGLPLPSIESPKGTDGNAYDKFKKEYGDMWEGRELKAPNNIPDDSLFNAVKLFGEANQKEFDRVTREDRERMSNSLKQKLDTSNQWDLSAIKAQADSKFMSSGQQQTFLNNIPKPAGWDKATANMPTAPDRDAWLARTAAVPQYPSIGEMTGMASDLFGNITGGMGSSAKDYWGEIRKEQKDAKAEHKKMTKDLSKRIAKGEEPTDAELKSYFDTNKRVSNARLQPIKDIGNGIANKTKSVMTKREEEAANKRTIVGYNAKKEAEKKYGKGNTQYLWDFGGKPVYVKADSFIGKTANKRQARTEERIKKNAKKRQK